MTVDYLCVLFCSGRENYMNRLSRCRFGKQVSSVSLLSYVGLWHMGLANRNNVGYVFNCV